MTLGKSITNERLLDVFLSASESIYGVNSSAKSRHWKKYYDYKIWNLEDLETFRSKDGLSVGLDDNYDFPISNYVRFVDELGEEKLLDLLDSEDIGQSGSPKYKGKFMDLNKMFAAYWFELLQTQVSGFKSGGKYLEIGGGFGQLAEMFIRKTNFKVVLVDLPEANLLSAFYLKQLHPEKRFFLFDDYIVNHQIQRVDFDEYDVFVLPPGSEFEQSVKFEIFVNTRSMMEMEKQVIKSYFDFIHKHSNPGALFLNVNRYEKNSVGEPIRIAEYPYDSQWDVLRSHANILQNHIHLILAKRITSDRIGSIVAELDQIAVLSQRYIYKKSMKEVLKRKFSL